MRLLLLLIPLALCSEFTPIIPTTNVEVKQYGWVTNEIEHHPRADGWCGTKSSSMANGCSNTVCDDPVLVQSYLDSLKNDQLDAVTLKYRVHYFCDAEGKNCPVTDEMNSDQLGVFNKGYSPLKLSFSAVAHPIAKPRFFGSDMLMCDPSQVGDGEADVDCLSVQTGYDGGDFMCQTPCNPSDPAVCTIRALATEECECFCADLTLCTSAMLADGQCHDECNWAQTQWSNGSCCFEGATKCRDPLSPYRNWYSTDDIKAEVADTPTDHFNVYLGRMPASSSLLGYATFPWDEQATAGTGGGLVFNLRNHAWGIFNQSEMIGITALHELGHALGLWHPFHHVSEWDSDEVSGNTKAAICAAPCFEHSPSWGTGDMIQDTPPTPINFLCTDPAPCSQSHNGWCSDCAGKSWSGTDYRNFMAYGDDMCLDHFTPQQWGRMRCVVDRYYAAWQTNPTPSTIVLAPTLAHFSYANNRTANMTWTAPLYPGQASLSGYVLERSPPFPGGATITLSGAATRYLDVGMADGNYRYRVWAVNGLGRATYPSPWSATVAVVPPEGFSFTLPVIICLSVVGGCVLLSVVFGIFLCRARRKSHQSHLAAVVLTPVSTADGAPSAAVTMSEPLIAAEDK